jgi:predicted ATPase/DNA-binding winged helix-turn-helix (wHTH) protein
MHGRILLDPSDTSVLLDGQPVAIGPRARAVLQVLLEWRGRLISKHELIEAAWPGRVVEANNLPVQIMALRKALGADCIVTVPGRGYRLADDPAGVAAIALPVRGPDLLAPLVGRDAERAALDSALHLHALVTLTGAGGIGKSALARRVLRDRSGAPAHGVAWIDLEAMSQPEQLPSAVATGIGVRLAADTPEALVAALRSLEILVCLDGAERFVDAVARFADAALAQLPGLRLLVTSQVPLRLKTERVLRLKPLALPGEGCTLAQARQYGAVALFELRARAADLRFELDEGTLTPVLQVCRRLDGLPLAIELAAARLPMFGARALANELAKHLSVLGSRHRNMPQRQRTLRAGFEWSHGLLGEAEQIVFRRMGVFAGGSSLEMIREVVADPALDEWRVIDALGELVERGLVDVSDAEPPRYQLLQTARVFARERLEAAGERAALRSRHALATTARFKAFDAAVWEGRARRDDLIASLRPELDDAREALAWAVQHEPLAALELAVPLYGVLRRTLVDQARGVWESTEPLLSDTVPRQVRAAWAAGYAMLWVLHDQSKARVWAEAALADYLALGDRGGELRARFVLVQCLSRKGDAAASMHLGAMQAIDHPGLPAAQRFLVRTSEATLASWQDRQDEAIEAYGWAALMAEAMGDEYLLAATQSNTINAHVNAGRWPQAVELGARLAERLRSSRMRTALALALLNLVESHLLAGDHASARVVASEGWPLAKVSGLQRCWADLLAKLAIHEGRFGHAALLLGYGDECYAAFGVGRVALEARVAQEAETAARAALGDAEFARLRSRGRSLSEVQIAGIGLAESAAHRAPADSIR